MARLFALFVLAFVGGCASITHDFTLHARDGGPSGDGQASERGREVSIVMGGDVYKGQYLIDTGKTITSYNAGSANAYSGTTSASVTGRSTTNTYIPGSGNGQLLATSPNGDALRCEFQYVYAAADLVFAGTTLAGNSSC